MRIVLLNDTGANGHLGCEAVSNALRRHLHGCGITDITAIFNRQLKCGADGALLPGSEAMLHHRLHDADFVILNGEGTLHHDRAPELVHALDMVMAARVPFAVVNALFADFPSLVPALKAAEAVTLRDGRSLAVARGMGVEASLCGDAVLYAAFDPVEAAAVGAGRDGGTLVTDWHGAAPGIARIRSEEALAAGAVYFPFSRPDSADVWPVAPKRMAQVGHVVTGRYHGAIFALLAARRLTMLPSNSHKMTQLLVDLGVTHDPESERDWPRVLDEAQVAQARDELRRIAGDPTLHPLAPLRLDRRVRPAAALSAARSAKVAPPPPAEDDLSPPTPLQAARDCADRVLIQPEGRALRQRLGRLAPGTLRTAATHLLHEGHPEKATLLLAELAPADPEAAFRLALDCQQAAPGNVTINLRLAGIAAHAGQPALALATYAAAHESAPLVPPMAQRAAILALQQGQPDRALSLALPGPSAAPPVLPSDPDDRRLATALVAAVRADAETPARDIARLLLQGPDLLSGDTRDLAARTLAATGAFAEGCRAMSESLATRDPVLAEARAHHLGPDGKGSLLVIPDSLGVGNAVLLAMPLLDDRVRLEGPVTILVDERLHAPFARVLPTGTRLLPTGSGLHGRFRHVVTGFDLLAALGSPEEGDRSSARPILRPDPANRDRLRARYRDRFGPVPLVGLAWHTSNTRSARARNWPLDMVRHFLSRHGDTRFVSLQPDIAQALRHARLICSDNLWVDEEIDPKRSISAQLDQISALDAVVTTDCSAAFFSAALGCPTHLVLPRTPYWQWPRRRSHFGHVTIHDRLEEIDAPGNSGSP